MAIECFWRPKQLLHARSSRLGHRARTLNRQDRPGPSGVQPASKTVLLLAAFQVIVRDAATMASRACNRSPRCWRANLQQTAL
jgi:hypothetical protein